MKKNICISFIVLFVTLNMYSQELFEKKGMWGIDIGLIYYSPKLKYQRYGIYYPKDYESGDPSWALPKYSVTYLTFYSGIGKHFGFSRKFKLISYNDKNYLHISPCIELSNIKYEFSSQTFYQTSYNESNYFTKHYVNEYSFAGSIFLDNIIRLKDNVSLITSVNIRYNIIKDRNLIRKYTSFGFRTGCLFGINSIILSPFVEFKIYDNIDNIYIKDFYLNYYSLPFYFNYENIKFGITFNF